MRLLFCNTCNTLHRKYEWTLHKKQRTTIGPEGWTSTRKVELIEKYFCPICPDHDIKFIEIRRIDNDEERNKFNSLFKGPRPKHKKEYKDTISKYCSYIDFNEYSPFDLLEFRQRYFNKIEVYP